MMKNKIILYLLCLSLIYALFITEYGFINEESRQVIVPYVALLILYIPISWSYNFFSFKHKTPIIYQLMIGYMIVVSISILRSDYYDSLNVIKDLVKSLLWCITFFAGYKIGIRNSDKGLSIISNIMFVGCAVVTASYFMVSSFHLHTGDVDYSDAIFPIIVFLPYIFLVKKNSLQLIGTIVIGVAVLYSFKRSIIIAYVGSILIYIIFQWIASRQPLYKKLFRIGLVLITLWGSFNYIEGRTDGYIVERFRNLEQSGGSGRDDLYFLLYNKVLQSPDNKLFFGNGYHASISVAGKLAHNDFLEVIYDFGVFAFMFYVGVHICFMVYLVRFYRARAFLQGKTCVFFIAYFNILCLGLFNCFITYTAVINVSMLLMGLLIGNYSYIKYKSKKLS